MAWNRGYTAADRPLVQLRGAAIFAKQIAKFDFARARLSRCALPDHRSMLAAVSLALAVAVAGCGDASRPHATTGNLAATQATRGAQLYHPVAPSGTAARVAGQVISVAAFDHLLSSELDTEQPSQRLVPPDFTACVASHEAVVATKGIGSPRVSTTALRAECEKEYHRLRQSVLDHLISAVWVIGGARELGVDATHGEVEALVRKSQYQFTAAREYLDSEAIRRAVRRRVGTITATRIANYYHAHKELYFVPQQRDLRIIRTRTQTEALAVKRKLASRRDFASAARAISAQEPELQQPFYSKEGLVLGLKPGVYQEKSLDHAIFTARPRALVGPVTVVSGFPGSFVLEVTRVVPGRQKPLREVETSLRSELPELLYQQALVSFISSWRAKWRAGKDCRPAFVVLKCRQFRGSSAAVHEDPYTLN